MSCIARRRTHARPKLPAKAISTIHKAKGLEFDNVMLLPCDRANFGHTKAARAKLCVAQPRYVSYDEFLFGRKNDRNWVVNCPEKRERKYVAQSCFRKTSLRR